MLLHGEPCCSISEAWHGLLVIHLACKLPSRRADEERHGPALGYSAEETWCVFASEQVVTRNRSMLTHHASSCRVFAHRLLLLDFGSYRAAPSRPAAGADARHAPRTRSCAALKPPGGIGLSQAVLDREGDAAVPPHAA